MTICASYFPLATLCYTACLAAALLPGRSSRPAIKATLAVGLIVNAIVVGLRFYQAWPMLPMYLGAQALPLALGLLLLVSGPSRRPPLVPAASALWATAVLAALFPKDYYLPFVKSATYLAHLFFVFATLGKACFLASAAWAAGSLGARASGNRDADRFIWWAVLGFGCWTLSMFCGQLWSYMGWSVPVVWDDPAIVTFMATWFFYVCLLHLHLTGSWSRRQRAVFAAAGGPLVILLNFLPDLGPLRIPLSQ